MNHQEHSIKKRCLIIILLFGLLITGCDRLTLQIPQINQQQPSPTHTSTNTIQARTDTPLPPTPTPTLTPSPSPTSTTTPTPIPSNTPTSQTYIQGPYFYSEDINPLTGLPASSQGLLNRRPIAIKITHFPRSVRPQWGTMSADHVFEYYIGDNMTRFIAIYYGRDAERVGPIRSARLFDEDIMRMYNAIFVFGYADDFVLEPFLEADLHNRLLIERPENCPPLCRIGPQNAYNNLYGNTSQISQFITERGTNNDRQDLKGLRFESTIPESGRPAQELALQFTSQSYHRWVFDGTSSQYLRYQETKSDVGDGKKYTVLTDNLTDQPVKADNVIVLRITHQYSYKSSSTEVFAQPFEGQGSGYALRDGMIYPITWTHPSAEKMVTLHFPNQQIYPLKPGNVWFEIIGESSEFQPQTAGFYKIEFSIP